MLFSLCFLMGSVVVFQPAINRMVLDHKGLGFAVFLNSVVLFIIATVLFALVFSMKESVPPLLQYNAQAPFKIWYLLPGIMGFMLVFIVPILFKQLGAAPTVIAMLLGQICTSFLWDLINNSQEINLTRICGLLLAAGGAYLSFKPTV